MLIHQMRFLKSDNVVRQKYSVAGVNAQIRVDHNQEAGTPRGLICDSCNTGLGRFKNGEDHLQSAIEYLAATEGLGEDDG